MAVENAAELRKVRQYRLKSVREETPSIRIFVFEPVSDPIPLFAPGQFVNVYATDAQGKPVVRPYSIASAPETREIELCIKIHENGAMSGLLAAKKAGDMLGISGPYGLFKYEGQQDAVFIAAGTGIAPMMSMLRHIKQAKIRGNFTLFYSNKSHKSIAYHSELKKLGKSNIKTVFTLTQEVPDGWKGEKGRVCSEMFGKHLKDAAACTYFMCGPVEFVKAATECVVSLGAKPENIKSEGWG